MTSRPNLSRIIQILREYSQGLCDDCLSGISGIAPRQTINQLCRRQEKLGNISRNKGLCTQGDCQKVKLVNRLRVNVHESDARAVRLRDQTNALANYSHQMTKMLSAIEKLNPINEPFAARVTRLRRERMLPGAVAATMLSINSQRNHVLHEREILNNEEWGLVEHGWRVLEAWWKKSSFSTQA